MAEPLLSAFSFLELFNLIEIALDYWRDYELGKSVAVVDGEVFLTEVDQDNTHASSEISVDGS